MAFLTLEPTPDLSATDRRRAHRLGSPAAAVRTSYPSLLRGAGFVGIESLDQTANYRSTLIAWIEALAKREEAVRAVEGDGAYDDRVKRRSAALEGIDAGLLSRSMYWATRPF